MIALRKNSPLGFFIFYVNDTTYLHDGVCVFFFNRMGLKIKKDA